MMVMAPMVAGSVTVRLVMARPSNVVAAGTRIVIRTVDAAPFMSMSPRPAPQGAVLPLTPPSEDVWVTGFSPACGATCDVRAAMGTSGCVWGRESQRVVYASTLTGNVTQAIAPA